MKRVISLVFQNEDVDPSVINQLKNISYNHNVQMVNVQQLLDEVIQKNDYDLLKQKVIDEYTMIQSGLPMSRIEQYSQNMIIEIIKHHLNKMVVQQRDILLVGYPRRQCQFEPNN